MALKYRREIDGLRAVAVVPVILSHAGLPGFAGGFVGVDVFFVISGYLITSILRRELEAGAFSIARFYERRARRILPALFVVLLSCLPFAGLWLKPLELKAFSASLLSVLVFASNFVFARQGGYFDAPSEDKPLLHTWSLAVEEQFYVLFPLVLWLVWRWRARLAPWVVVALGLVSFVGCEIASHLVPTFDYFSTPTRAWELMAGAFCAFVRTSPHDARDGVLSAAGLLAIAASVFWMDSGTRYPSVYTLVPVGGACLVLLFATNRTATARLLSRPPMVGIGLISYSAYLWHQPLLAFARVRSIAAPSPWLMAALALACFPLAWLTWRYVETPFRNQPGTRNVSVPRLIGVSLSAALVLGVFCLGVHVTKGFAFRFTPSPLASSKEFRLATIDDGYCFYSVHDDAALEIGERGTNCHLGSADEKAPRALLFGDSFAAQWEPFWDLAGKRFGIRIDVVTTNWCYPSLSANFETEPAKAVRAYSQCLFDRQFVRDAIDRYRLVVLGGDWARLAQRGELSEVFDFIEETRRRPDAPRIVIMPSPRLFWGESVKSAVATGQIDLVTDDRMQMFADTAHGALARYAATARRVLFLDGKDLFGNYFGSNGTLTDERLPYSLDGQHISLYGARKSFETLTGEPEALGRVETFLRPELETASPR